VLRLILPDQELTPSDQLACDEAILNLADQGRHEPAIRLWHFQRPVVVLGRSSKHAEEVDWQFCRRHDLPVLRRTSGGAAVVGGPGCLMYSVVLPLGDHGDLRKIDAAHRFVMGRVLAAVQKQAPEARRQGVCDLTLGDKKFSGNSLRITRGHLLYHGTVLHDGDLDLIAGALAQAPRQPDYRAGRDHRQFITNIDCDPIRLADDLADVFDAAESLRISPARQDSLLVREMFSLKRQRYDDQAWHRHR